MGVAPQFDFLVTLSVEGSFFVFHFFLSKTQRFFPSQTSRELLFYNLNRLPGYLFFAPLRTSVNQAHRCTVTDELIGSIEGRRQNAARTPPNAHLP